MKTTFSNLEETVEPFDLEEAKLWCKVETETDESILSSLIVAARKYAESQTNLLLRPMAVVTTFDSFGTILDLPFCPVTDVDEITYFDSNGDEQTLDEEDYFVSLGTPCKIVAKSSFPATQNRPDAVSVSYSAGETPDEDIKTAMKLLICHWYEHRAGVELGTIATVVPFTIESLFNSAKNWRI